jgi:hypothetical protein
VPEFIAGRERHEYQPSSSNSVRRWGRLLNYGASVMLSVPIAVWRSWDVAPRLEARVPDAHIIGHGGPQESSGSVADHIFTITSRRRFTG